MGAAYGGAYHHISELIATRGQRVLSPLYDWFAIGFYVNRVFVFAAYSVLKSDRLPFKGMHLGGTSVGAFVQCEEINVLH